MKDHSEVESYQGPAVRINRYDYNPIKFRAAVAFTNIPYIPIGVIDAAEGEGYKQKSASKMHITLLPDELFDKLGKIKSDALSADLEDSCDRSGAIDLSDEIYEISKPKKVTEGGMESKYERQSLVVSLDPESTFTQEVNELYSRYIPKEDFPFLHITLFTRPSNKYADEGIGIASQKEWEEMQKRYYGRLRQSA